MLVRRFLYGGTPIAALAVRAPANDNALTLDNGQVLTTDGGRILENG